MRKVLLLVLLSMAISLSAKAQIDRCERVTEVERTYVYACWGDISHTHTVQRSKDCIGVEFKNNNPFKVNVYYYVSYKGEKVSDDDKVSIEGNSKSNYIAITHWAGEKMGENFDKKYLVVQYNTVKCPQ